MEELINIIQESEPKYQDRVSHNIHECENNWRDHLEENERPSVKFGVLGHGHSPNYQVEIRAGKKKTFYGIGQKKHTKPVFEEDHVTKQYTMAEFQEACGQAGRHINPVQR